MESLIQLIENNTELRKEFNYVPGVTFCHLLSSETFRTELLKQPKIPDISARIEELIRVSKVIDAENSKVIAKAINPLHYQLGLDLEPIPQQGKIFPFAYVFSCWSFYVVFSLTRLRLPITYKAVMIPTLFYGGISYSAFLVWDHFRPIKQQLKKVILDPSKNLSNEERFVMINLLHIFGMMYEFLLLRFFKHTWFPSSFNIEFSNYKYNIWMKKYPSLLR